MGKDFRKLSLIVAVFFCLTGCEEKKIEKFFTTESFPDQIIKNFTIDKYESESHMWNFFAVRGDVYEKKKIINAKNIKVNFYENSGEIGTIVYADKAVVNADTGDIKAEGNITIFSLLKDTTVFIETLNYSEKSKKLSSNSFIRQEKRGVVVTGDGFEANSDLSEITILKNVKVVRK
ncbi:MAG: LPS export ABC transporter periplasmic protein LptC [Elusimicrobiota bacterium]